MGAIRGVLAVTGSMLVACGDDGGSSPGTIDAAPLPTDATVDAAAGRGAIVRMTADAHVVAAGTDVTVRWTSEGATACAVRTSTGRSATGTSGELIVRVDDLARAVVSCEPPGRASVAAIGLARRCVGELVVGNVSIVGEQFFGIGDTVVPPDACLVATGNLTVSAAAPAIAARVRRVGGIFFDMKAGANALDLVALESVGKLGLDYQNGRFGLDDVAGVSGLAGLDRSFQAFPSLTAITGDNQGVRAATGRLDLRATDRFGLSIGAYLDLGHEPEVIELRDGTTLLGVDLGGTELARTPMLLGRPAGVEGDVTIRDNRALPHAEAMALVAALGPIGGTVLVCNNLDDDPCP